MMGWVSSCIIINVAFCFQPLPKEQVTVDSQLQDLFLDLSLEMAL